MKATGTCLQLLHATVPHSTSSSLQTLVSCCVRSDRSSLSCKTSSTLFRTRSCEFPKSVANTLRRSRSASLDEFAKIDVAVEFEAHEDDGSLCADFEEDEVGTMEPPWIGNETMIAESIKRKASCFDIPVSIRMIRKKRRWHEGFFIEAGESACCSVRKAFSSMVFIVRELQSFTLKMRDVLPNDELQRVIARVQKEIQASFIWLFRHVFSPTPTLMIHVMILMANFTVSSMASRAAVAVPPEEIDSVVRTVAVDRTKTDFFVSSVGGSNGGSNGGGERRNASGTGDDDGFDGAESRRFSLSDGDVSSLVSRRSSNDFDLTVPDDELRQWNTVSSAAAALSGMSVPPVKAKLKDGGDGGDDHTRTELMYQISIAQDPGNPLLLANYAQFLYVVARDCDRAEEYFKMAVAVRPADAEAYSKYAGFLWAAKEDLWAAEEAFLEAIAADPSNSFYAGNYAHFLWNTGGEDTCYPITGDDDDDNLKF